MIPAKKECLYSPTLRLAAVRPSERTAPVLGDASPTSSKARHRLEEFVCDVDGGCRLGRSDTWSDFHRWALQHVFQPWPDN
jgi:hypothetical protein